MLCITHQHYQVECFYSNYTVPVGFGVKSYNTRLFKIDYLFFLFLFIFRFHFHILWKNQI